MCDGVYLNFRSVFVSSWSFLISEQDEEINKIQAAVAAGMAANSSQLQAYLKAWDKYRDIWEINKDSFIRRYQRLNPPVTSFAADIHRHCAIFFNFYFLPVILYLTC